MTTAQHRIPARRAWTREVIELAVLCLAAASAHLLLGGPGPTASYLLIAAGMALLAGAAARHMWVHRAAAAPEPLPEPTGRGTLWRLRAAVADRPGRLAELAAGLARLGGDIRTLHVHPVADGAVDELLVHVPSTVDREELVRAVAEAGGRDVTACRADVHELDDVPTRTLALAGELVAGSGDLARALRGLLGDVRVDWRAQAPAEHPVDEFAERELLLSAPGGGVLVLHRPGTAFTPAEFARARAMVVLAASCPQPREVHEFCTTDGHELTVHVADHADRDAVAEFHARCSAATRYLGESLRLLPPSLGRSLLVRTAGGEVVAMGNLVRDDEDAQIALLVRDDWQRRGIGSQLTARLIAEAGSAGLRTVRANTRVDNTAIARTLRAAGLKLVGVPEPGEWAWSRSLPAAV